MGGGHAIEKKDECLKKKEKERKKIEDTNGE